MGIVRLKKKFPKKRAFQLTVVDEKGAGISIEGPIPREAEDSITKIIQIYCDIDDGES